MVLRTVCEIAMNAQHSNPYLNDFNLHYCHNNDIINNTSIIGLSFDFFSVQIEPESTQSSEFEKLAIKRG